VAVYPTGIALILVLNGKKAWESALFTTSI
jgi:hypothetical protein